ncbi:MAG TPA: tetratricopeptide repeat protein [Polyangia bacterium]|jgi:hypothetical protein|nr:tetratricopeptide repeat protein [Polyangia bacterium]
MTHRLIALLFTTGLVLCTLAVPGQALAQAKKSSSCAEAETRIRLGLKMRAEHRDDGALEEFQRAYRLCSSARALAQIALAEQATGRWNQAEQHLEIVLSTAGDSWVEQHRGDLENAREALAQRLGSLEVSLTPTDATGELLLNGERVARLPLEAPLRVVAGTVTIEVRVQGFTPVTRPVTIPPAGRTREVVALTPIAPPPPVALEKPAPEKSPQPPPVMDRERAERPRPRGRSLQRTLGIAGLSVGGAGLAVGIAGHVLREQNARAWNRDDACVHALPDSLPSQCQTRRNAVELGQQLAIAGYVTGGVLAVAGVLLLALPARTGEGRPKARAQLVPGPGQIGVGLRTTF